MPDPVSCTGHPEHVQTVMPDLIRHPERVEKTWIPDQVGNDKEKGSGMTKCGAGNDKVWGWK